MEHGRRAAPVVWSRLVVAVVHAAACMLRIAEPLNPLPPPPPPFCRSSSRAPATRRCWRRCTPRPPCAGAPGKTPWSCWLALSPLTAGSTRGPLAGSARRQQSLWWPSARRWCSRRGLRAPRCRRARRRPRRRRGSSSSNSSSWRSAAPATRPLGPARRLRGRAAPLRHRKQRQRRRWPPTAPWSPCLLAWASCAARRLPLSGRSWT